MKKPKTQAEPENKRITLTKSALKYVYLGAFFMLLSGLFHPLITGTSFDGVVAGTFVLFVGLLGGILVYKGAYADKYRAPLLGSGFALAALSLWAVFSLTGRI